MKEEKEKRKKKGGRKKFKNQSKEDGRGEEDMREFRSILPLNP